ncbi:phage tail tape measure protein [Brevibacillus laterosporus]|uniref:phage tail tape measure protein n=1 Tax=Brevibacillus laterosporus TaxID=1465 RepID=UPI003D203F0E
MEDFSILIGVDMSDAESKIESTIKSIGTKYPLKLQLEVSDGDLKNIQKLFKVLEHIDVDLGLEKDSKILKDMKQSIEKISKTDVSNVGDELTDSLKEANKQSDALNKSFDNLMKKREAKNPKKSTTTEKTGNKFDNITVTTNNQTGKEELREHNRDFAGLADYQSKAIDKLSSFKNIDTKKVEELQNRIQKLNQMLESKDPAFQDELKDIQKLIKSYDALERQVVEEKQTQVRQTKEAIIWEKKLAEIRREGLSNPASVNALSRRVDALKNGNYKTNDELEKHLQNINKQHAKVIGSRDENKFRRKAVNEGEKMKKKFDNNIDESLVGSKDFAQIQQNLKKIFSAETTVQLENAIKRAIELYDKLLQKQIDVARQNKMTKGLDEWSVKIDEIKSKGFVNESDFNAVRSMMAKLNTESKEFEANLKQIEQELNKVNFISNQRQGKNEKINVTKYQNNNKADDMLSNGLVPESMISDFKALNNMLDFASSKEDVAMINRELQKLVQLEGQIKNAGREEARIRELIAQAQRDSIKATDKYSDIIDSVVRKSNEQIADIQRKNEVEQEATRILQQINDLKNRSTQISYDEHRAIQQQIAELKRLQQAHKNVEAEEEARLNKIKQINEKFESVDYRSKRGFKDGSPEYDEIKRESNRIRGRKDNLSSLSGEDFKREAKEIEEEMNRLSTRASRLRDQERDRNASFFGQMQNAMKKVPIWVSAMSIFYGALSQVQQGFRYLLDVDKAMTNLTKVTEVSKGELEEFKATASQMGKELGVLASEVIKATTEFQKLGYNLEQASQLGQNSILYANVGDMGIEEASQALVSTIKGFGVEVDKQGNNVRKIVDMFNEVGNNFAVSSEGIGEALKRSSATLKEAGNSMAESIGLVTAANSTIQDPKIVGTALKTVSMRLRGVDEEGKVVATLIPEIQKTFDRINRDLGKNEGNGLNILKNGGKDFKSTYEIMKDIRDVWDELSDIERANLVEVMGGKHQGNIVASIISNWKDAENATNTAINSAGSASREFEAYMESFDYKIGQLKNALELFWTTLVDDDGAKNLIDTLTEIINTMTELVKVMGAEGVLGAFFGLLTLFNKGVRDALLLGGAVKGLGGAVKGLATTVMSFGKMALRFAGWIGLLVVVAEGIGKIVDMKNEEAKKRKENLDTIQKEITELENLKKSYENFDDKFKGGIDRYAQLENMGNNKTNEEYAEYIRMQEYIKNEMPQMISHYNEYGQAVLKSADQIKNLRIENEKLLASKKRDEFKFEMEDADFDELEKRMKEYQEHKDRVTASETSAKIRDMVKDYVKSDLEGLDRTSEEYRQKLITLNKMIEEEVGKLSENQQRLISFDMNSIATALMNHGDTNGIVKEIDFLEKSVGDRTKRMTEGMKQSKEEVRKSMTGFSDMLQKQLEITMREKGIGRNDNKFIFAEELKKSIENNFVELGGEIPDIINNFGTTFDIALKSMKNSGVDLTNMFKFDANTASATLKQIDDAIENLQNSGSANVNILIQVLEVFRAKHAELIQQVNNSVPHFDWVTNVYPVVDGFIGGIKDLDSAYRNLADGQELSIANTMEIVAKYPKLLNYLESENGALKLNANAIKEMAKIKEEEFKRDLQMKKEEAINAKNKAEAVIQAILSEAKATQLLADIKAKGAKQTADQLENYRFMARKMGEDDLVDEYAKQIDAVQKTGKQLEEVAKIDEQIANIEKLLNMDWTSKLGSITSSPKKKKKKELQDAIYVTDEYKKKMDELNASIAEQQRLQKLNAQYSGAYRYALNEEIKLTDKKRQAIEKQITALQKQVDNKKIQKTGLITLSKDDNKTARAKQAEIQQEIDQTIEKVNQLKQEYISVGETINSLRWSFLQSNVELYNIQREMLTDDISYQEYAMELYDESSDKYRTHAREKLKFVREQQEWNKQELDYLEREKAMNSALTDQQISELNHLIREKRKAIYEMAQTIDEVENAIINSHFEEKMAVYASESKKYADEIRRIEDQIKYDTKEDDYAGNIKYLKEIVGLRKGEITDIKATLAELYAMKNRHKDNLEIVGKIKDEIEQWEDKLKDSQSAVKELNKRIKDVYEELADKMVDLYKEQLKLMQKAEEDAYKDMMDAEQKRHEQRIKNIEKELKILEDAYNKQMKMIDREEATRDYENDTKKMDDEIKQLREQINTLSLDDSYEAKAKKAELVRQLTEKEMELAEVQHDREVELRKNNLEDDYEAEKDKLEKRKEGYEDDFKNWKAMEEKKQDERKKYWEDELNNEKKFAELRQEVLDGNFEGMLETVANWSENVSSHMGELGETITENFTYKVEQAIERLKELSSMGLPSYNRVVDSTNPTNLDGDKPEHIENPKGEGNLSELSSSETNIVKKMMGNSDKWLDATDPKKKAELHQKNVDLSKGISGAYYQNGTWYKNGKKLYNLVPFDTGGYTGDWEGDKGKLAILHKKELVLNEQQTKHILDTARLFEKIKNITPNINLSGLQEIISQKQKQETIVPTPIEQNEYTLNVNIERMNGDKKSADIVAGQIINNIKRTKGGRF